MSTNRAAQAPANPVCESTLQWVSLEHGGNGMCRLFQTGTNQLADTSAGRASFVQLDAKRTQGGHRSPALSPDQALDCWCHGVAHLFSALGRDAALSLMARTVVDLVDLDPDPTALPPAPHAA